jgi:hypothetical protein
MNKNEKLDEFIQMQYVASVELRHPIQYGKRKVSHMEITMKSHDSVALNNGVLAIPTDVEDKIENIPESNLVKWRVDAYVVPIFPNHPEAYEYNPYTYPNQVGGYLGSYSDEKGCIGFLDAALQITTMKELEA